MLTKNKYINSIMENKFLKSYFFELELSLQFSQIIFQYN